MTEVELIKNLENPLWRLRNFYRITTKEETVELFSPNQAQQQLLDALHTRNIILKARQRGFSTVIQLLMLDCCLFQPNYRAVVIAQDKTKAEEIFKGKLKFAYNNLPDAIRDAWPLQSDSKTALEFPNGSSVSVTSSARSGTVNFLHVSEFGKIAAATPGKAVEIVTGSFPAVPSGGIICVESTAEGQDGEFYRLVQQARALEASGLDLSPLDWKFHFYSWWDADEYRAPITAVPVSPKDHEYFDALERTESISLPNEKRAWYCQTRDVTFSGDEQKMWQEYPSTADEAFKVSLAGAYYTKQLEVVRKDRRIASVPIDPAVPVNTFWDIGQNDETAIWLIQDFKTWFGVVDFLEASGEPFAYFVEELKKRRCVWGRHYLPHDAEHMRQLGLVNKSARQMLQDLVPGWRFEVVSRTPDLIAAINQTRDAIPLCRFDAEKCKEGIRHLELYRKEWDSKRAIFKDEPRHDEHSNAADAFRQFAQARASHLLSAQTSNVARPVTHRQHAYI